MRRCPALARPVHDRTGAVWPDKAIGISRALLDRAEDPDSATTRAFSAITSALLAAAAASSAEPASAEPEAELPEAAASEPWVPRPEAEAESAFARGPSRPVPSGPSTASPSVRSRALLPEATHKQPLMSSSSFSPFRTLPSYQDSHCPGIRPSLKRLRSNPSLVRTLRSPKRDSGYTTYPTFFVLNCKGGHACRKIASIRVFSQRQIGQVQSLVHNQSEERDRCFAGDAANT